MSQETSFCVVCALLRLDRGEHPALVLAGLPANPKRLGHPVCRHHRLMLGCKPMDAPRTMYPTEHYNGTPVMEFIGLEVRDTLEQIELIAFVRGDFDWGVDGMLNMLYWRRWQYQKREWERESIDQQPTTVLPSQQEQREEAAANERLFERIAGYLALKAAGLNTGEVAVVDDPDDQISGEELQQIRDFFEKHPHFFDNRLGEE